MTPRGIGGLAAGAILAAIVVSLALTGGETDPSATRPAAVVTGQVTKPPAAPRFGGALEGCSTRSEASFPGAFTDPQHSLPDRWS